MSRRAGFTMIEICLVMLIALCLMALAVPSIKGMLAEQRMRRSFEDFDRFVRHAQFKSVNERRAYVMVWEEDGIALLPVEPKPADVPEAKDRFDFGEDETFELERPFALMKKPVAEWIFWKSGTCEPVLVAFAGPAGKWVVRYNPLTARSTFESSEVL